MGSQVVAKDKLLERLNSEQAEAVCQEWGPRL